MVKLKSGLFGVLSLLMLLILSGCGDSRTYVVVDTMQSDCYDTEGNVIECGSDADLVGQDAEYETTVSDYTTSDDLTVVTDNNTGLVWQYSQSDQQVMFSEAAAYCEEQTTGGYDDWRLPSLKELYSIADFNGALSMDEDVESQAYLDTDYFDFEYGIHPFATQFWSSTEYNLNKVAGDPTDPDGDAAWAAFGFNFADGHIKAYGSEEDQRGLYIRCVRGDEDYAVNDFELNEDETIVTDNATGLMWQQSDGGETYSWPEALDHCEDLSLGGYNDWRLPDNKELQSIVDYQATETPVIDTEYFDCTLNPDYGNEVYAAEGEEWAGDYGWYWTSTTLGDFPENASYITFGRAYATGNEYTATLEGEELAAALANADYFDYHGAGAQRSDPKDPALINDGTGCSDFACDEERGYNYARCVRGVVGEYEEVLDASSY